MQSSEKQIEMYLKARVKGKIYFTSDFRQLVPESAIRMALSRLCIVFKRLQLTVIGLLVTVVSLAQPNVYVVGWEGNRGSYARFWKNGVLQDLTDGVFPETIEEIGIDKNIVEEDNETFEVSIVPITINDVATSVFVSENDVYVVGSNRLASKIWKNGVSQNPKSLKVSPNSLFITESDIYVAGYTRNEQFIATLLKNDTVHYLTDGAYEAWANAVFVLGRDIYVVGYETNEQDVRVAMLWKNETAIKLTDGTYDAIAVSVYVANNDVYIAGFKTNEQNVRVAMLWKNGVSQNLTDGNTRAGAGSVYVFENDVYVAGDEGMIATVWKNGVAQKLTDGSRNSSALSVFVK